LILELLLLLYTTGKTVASASLRDTSSWCTKWYRIISVLVSLFVVVFLSVILKHSLD
jgi:hypothetical protein